MVYVLNALLTVSYQIEGSTSTAKRRAIGASTTKQMGEISSLFPYRKKNRKHKGQFQISSSCMSRYLLMPTKTHPFNRRDVSEHLCCVNSFIEHTALCFLFEYRRYRGDVEHGIIELIQPALKTRSNRSLGECVRYVC